MSIGQSDASGKRLETASYQYDHRGLRNSKTLHGEKGNAQSTTTHYLYSEDKQLLAEISADGKITRQYVYLADMPIAVIDTTQGNRVIDRGT